MSIKFKSVLYLKIMVDLIAEYFIAMGIVSFSIVCHIISAGMSEENLSFESLFRLINSFYVCVLLVFGILICCEIFIFGKHRYLRADFIGFSVRKLHELHDRQRELKNRQKAVLTKMENNGFMVKVTEGMYLPMPVFLVMIISLLKFITAGQIPLSVLIIGKN